MTHKGGTVVAIPRLSSAQSPTTGFTAVLENTSGARVTGTFTWIAGVLGTLKSFAHPFTMQNFTDIPSSQHAV